MTLKFLLNVDSWSEWRATIARLENTWRKRVILRPNNPMSRFNLGVVLAQLQDAAGAKEQLEKAIELGATEPQVRFELAKVLRMLGETEEAQQQLKLYQQKTKEEVGSISGCA